MRRMAKTLFLLLSIGLLTGCGSNGSTTGSSTSTSTSTSTPTEITKYTVQTVGWSIKGGTNFVNSSSAKTELLTLLNSGSGLITSIDIKATDNVVMSQIFGKEESSVGFTFGSKQNTGEVTLNFSKKLRYMKLDCVGYWKTWTSGGGGSTYDVDSTLDIYCNDGKSPESSIVCIQEKSGTPAGGIGQISTNVGWDKITLKNIEVGKRVIINSIEFGY